MKKGFFRLSLLAALSYLFFPASHAGEVKALQFKQVGEVGQLEIVLDGENIEANKFNVTEDKQIVIDLTVGEDKTQLLHLVNPEFVLKEGEQRHEEGCLSIPGYGGSPVRPARVVVKGLDLDGREREYEGTELLARAFCHEIDHIDGLLFVDRLSPLKRDLMKRKLKKQVRSGWDE